MKLFKLSIKDDATAAERQTTTEPGPILIEAESEQSARRLANLNYSIAVRMHPGEKIPVMIWNDGGASRCDQVIGVSPSGLRPTYIVANRDIADRFIDQELLETNGRIVARMIWWPCGPNKRICPV